MTEKDREEVELVKGHEKLINTEASTILEKTPNNSAHQACQGSSSLKTNLCVAAALVCGVAIVGLVFAAGAMVGRVSALWTTAVHQNSTYNWGDHVTISGESVPVISWFDDEISADNIRSNLQ